MPTPAAISLTRSPANFACRVQLSHRLFTGDLETKGRVHHAPFHSTCNRIPELRSKSVHNRLSVRCANACHVVPSGTRREGTVRAEGNHEPARRERAVIERAVIGDRTVER